MPDQSVRGSPAVSEMPPAAGATPAMAQWFAAKANHPDALLFFRMGDFYELFFADAEAAAAALDIALTHRGEHAGAPIPMCGVPYHAADAYLSRLIRRGFRVAIAEQMEDPKARTGKQPIKREVVRVITPGTVTEDSLLEAGRPNFLLALAWDKDDLGAAWIDVSTGLFETASVSAAELPALLGRLEPAEIVAPTTIELGEWKNRLSPEPVPSSPLVARRRLSDAFGTASMDAFGTFTDGEAVAAAMGLDYIRGTQAGTLPRLGRPQPQGKAGTLGMDAATRGNLEIHRSRDGGTQFTLLSAVQRTLSAAGARMLGNWLAGPLTDRTEILARQDAWSWFVAHRDEANRLRQILRSTPDMARALGRLSVNRGTPRDMAAIRDGLQASFALANVLKPPLPIVLERILDAITDKMDLADMLVQALADPAPARMDDGNVIRPGFDGQLDAHRALRDESRQVVAGLQMDYAQRYGVASLKIKHHAQLGYVLEAPTAGVEKLRSFPELTLRQGMANGARFTAPELSDLDQRIREAGEQASSRERTIIAHLTQSIMQHADVLARRADALALVDVLQSAARLAEGGTWIRPTVTDGEDFQIKAGRHPVVEAALGSQANFVPNDCDLSPECRLMLLTGPNMAGKSTFLRQNALFVVLSQAGLPVPAEGAVLGIVDRLFSRVGAADDLARGRSTFMVEMTETAAILHQAGPRSLVVVDEIGRGTSTLDGLAIAWAVLEALHSALRCRTIFATHFHELAELTDRLPRLRPHTMRVKEWKGNVVFLHEVAEGAARRSWGVHVAELAGVPASVVRRAATLMAAMEKQGGALGTKSPISALPLFAASAAEEPADTAPEPVIEVLKQLDPDTMSPRDALDALYRLKALVPPCEHHSA
ncbi:MAG TPA: DNA mismatch repair protein MutS [Rhodopila sp.]|nr:DNA mismatch repair protein MutS [Rhodopila sp.]